MMFDQFKWKICLKTRHTDRFRQADTETGYTETGRQIDMETGMGAGSDGQTEYTLRCDT